MFDPPLHLAMVFELYAQAENTGTIHSLQMFIEIAEQDEPMLDHPDRQECLDSNWSSRDGMIELLLYLTLL